MSLSDKLRAETTAVALKVRRLGLRRRLDGPAEAQAASVFDADDEYLTASKRLFDARNQHYRTITQVISRAKSYWRSMTVRYPAQKGIRLLRNDQASAFTAQMSSFAQQLDEAIEEFLPHYEPLKRSAREGLGSLYKPSDYPPAEELASHFSIHWSFVSIEPPDELKQLNPKLYEQEQERVRNEMSAAVAAAEQAFAVELQGLINGLCDALSGGADGTRKQLRPSAVTALSDFVERFESVRIGSNRELDEVMGAAKALIQGVDPKALKAATDKQQDLFGGLSSLKNQLDAMVSPLPTRAITLGDDDE